MGDTEWISDCGKARLILGDCLERLRELPDCSVDAVVTDPPYGLAFMGKKWDYDVPAVEVWAECLRVLKPGGHLLAFAGTRTQHRMAVRIEDAGFEIRDMIAWVYGSGFPKSLDVSKAIDKAAGAERERYSRPAFGGTFSDDNGSTYGTAICNAPATESARQWQGWGTSLKPALEPITVARKPLIGTVAENVLKHGTGGINVDGCRVGDNAGWSYPNGRGGSGWHGRDSLANNLTEPMEATQGRWPANLIHSGEPEVVGLFPQTTSGFKVGGRYARTAGVHEGGQRADGTACYGDTGSAARFFYVPKASKADREEGLDSFEAKFAPTMGNGIGGKEHDPDTATPKRNGHPTVKPTALMRYLCRLVTPPGGIVLDPFMGSGSTGKGAILEGFRFIGIEREAEYLEIAKARIAHAIANYKQPEDKPAQLSLLPDQP